MSFFNKTKKEAQNSGNNQVQLRGKSMPAVQPFNVVQPAQTMNNTLVIQRQVWDVKDEDKGLVPYSKNLDNAMDKTGPVSSPEENINDTSGNFDGSLQREIVDQIDSFWEAKGIELPKKSFDLKKLNKDFGYFQLLDPDRRENMKGTKPVYPVMGTIEIGEPEAEEGGSYVYTEEGNTRKIEQQRPTKGSILNHELHHALHMHNSLKLLSDSKFEHEQEWEKGDIDIILHFLRLDLDSVKNLIPNSLNIDNKRVGFNFFYHSQEHMQSILDNKITLRTSNYNWKPAIQKLVNNFLYLVKAAEEISTIWQADTRENTVKQGIRIAHGEEKGLPTFKNNPKTGVDILGNFIYQGELKKRREIKEFHIRMLMEAAGILDTEVSRVSDSFSKGIVIDREDLDLKPLGGELKDLLTPEKFTAPVPQIQEQPVVDNSPIGNKISETVLEKTNLSLLFKYLKIEAPVFDKWYTYEHEGIIQGKKYGFDEATDILEGEKFYGQVFETFFEMLIEKDKKTEITNEIGNITLIVKKEAGKLPFKVILNT